MAEEIKPALEAAKSPSPVAEPVKATGNPALRMMGLPRLRAKIPSRNWLIFLSVTGSFASAIIYDRHHKKKAQQKWCHAVSHLAKEALSVNQIPRKFTIVLAAPPGDGLRSAREYFSEYIKPILVAGALDWDVIEGRREGEVRAGVAERIRKLRKKSEESPTADTEPSVEDVIEGIRKNFGLQPSEGLQGDLVIGRHTWKEYVRGLHEGWLGPSDPPPEPPPHIPADSEMLSIPAVNDKELATATGSDGNSDSGSTSGETLQDPPPAPPTDPPRKAPSPIPPYITPSSYSITSPASSIPPTFNPALLLPFPHILGFINTPIRIYRYLTQRYLADEVGHMVADMVLASSIRPWTSTNEFASFIDPDSPSSGLPLQALEPGNVAASATRWEQQSIYEDEEREWHKIARAPDPAGQEGKERVWKEDMVVDERIGTRMTTFVLTAEDEERARVGMEKEDAERGKRKAPLGWVESVKIWTGWKDDRERVKGWEHGLVGNQSD